MTNLSLRTLVAAGLAAGAIALTVAPASAMNKKDLVNAIAKDAGTSRAIAAKMLDSFAKNTAAALANGNRVALAGFGSFSVSKLAGRTGRNPQTGAVIKIEARKIVKFKAAAALNNAVN
tara:strand:- start:322 stop:678 length:357 start_codon:yes stop_codon:yes gene_type:complete